MTSKRGVGDGDPCPLFPAHGHMFVLPAAPGGAPRQYCSHVEHDGHGDVPPTRALWPLYGLEDTLNAYLALASRNVELPDLTDLEV